MDKRDDVVHLMKTGDPCIPFDYNNPADNTHWAGAGHISGGGMVDWHLSMHNEITVEGDPGHVKLFGHIGRRTCYHYSFQLEAFWYTKPHDVGFITIQAARSTGKGEGQQFRVKLWDSDSKLFETFWLGTNVQCQIYVPYNPINRIWEIGVDSRDFNGPEHDYQLSQPFKPAPQPGQ